VVELAALTAMVSLLTTSLGTLQQRVADRLVTSNAVAVSQAVGQGRKAGVAAADTRAAYARAPYRLPALRYVYSLGWITGARHKTVCILAQLDVAGTRSQVIDVLRKSPQALRVVRRLHLTVRQAGTAFTAGFVSACGPVL
jgi:hypothetical protein